MFKAGSTVTSLLIKCVKGKKRHAFYQREERGGIREPRGRLCRRCLESERLKSEGKSQSQNRRKPFLPVCVTFSPLFFLLHGLYGTFNAFLREIRCQSCLLFLSTPSFGPFSCLPFLPFLFPGHFPSFFTAFSPLSDLILGCIVFTVRLLQL